MKSLSHPMKVPLQPIHSPRSKPLFSILEKENPVVAERIKNATDFGLFGSELAGTIRMELMKVQPGEFSDDTMKLIRNWIEDLKR